MTADSFQFQLDNRAAGPVRKTWYEAASDAICQGYATRVGPGEIKLDNSQGATIARGVKGDLR